ncbi:MAG: hypothetical protein HYX76_06580 [Acidobacteria bacterium]|nr:hypothetical protein [Acidobacteriota bacterium]
MDCVGQVNALGSKLDTLMDHTLRYLPALADMLGAPAAARQSEQLKSVRLQIRQVDGTFRRLAAASEEFRRGCSASHTTAVAAVVDDLLHEVWILEEMLDPGTRHAESGVRPEPK